MSKERTAITAPVAWLTGGLGYQKGSNVLATYWNFNYLVQNSYVYPPPAFGVGGALQDLEKGKNVVKIYYFF